MERKTPLYQTHVDAGGKIVEFGGFLMPVQYPTGVLAEHMAVRQKAGLFDVSHMGELRLKGPDAVANVQKLITADISAMQDGDIKYAMFCNDAGGIIDDFIVYRCAADDYWLVVNAGNRDRYYTFIDNVPLDLGSRTIHALVSQTGYTGEYGFELYCRAEDTVDLWHALLAAGEEYGLIPCGLGARDTLRLEASMPLYGHEMNEEITPKMAGLPCKLTGKDFIGRDALVALGAPKLKRIGMKVVGRGIVREHCDLYSMEGEKLGWTSSGTFAPFIGCGVAMGYIPVEDIEIGKHLNADVRGRMVELEIVPMPFYKLDK